ncbi:MAG: tyrosine-type recombinase/integrase [Acidimicrobiales bacterium]
MAWGNGSLRARRPGVWEIRMAVGVDPVSGRTVQRSFVFHGDAVQAALRRDELAHEWAERRAIRRATPFLTVGELLERWIGAHHDWRPATWIGARSNVKALRADHLAQRRVTTLTPEVVRAAMASWAAGGASVAVISGRFRVLRSALGWAHVERIVDVNPLSGMRGPTRPGTRLHLTHDEVIRLLATSERLVAEAVAVADETPHGWTRLHRVEQVRLLVRLAADSGARRGELVALRTGDLDGRVLTIERGVSAEQLGPTKTGPTRRLTLGRGTVELWEISVATWRERLARRAVFGDWLFSSEPTHQTRLTAGAAGHWFHDLCIAAEVPRGSLHRLRHSVATFLVGRGELLRAQQRLGHRDPSTTLRNYAHALPLEDEDVADDLDELLLLDGSPPRSDEPRPIAQAAGLAALPQGPVGVEVRNRPGRHSR